MADNDGADYGDFDESNQRLESVGTGGGPEVAGMRALIDAASVGRIVQFAASGRASDGPERELQTELNLQGNMVPLALLVQPGDVQRGTLEGARAAATLNMQTVAAPSQGQFWAGVFAAPVVRWLGIQTTRVDFGEQVLSAVSEPVKGPAAVAEGATVADTNVRFGTDSASPRRIQTSLVVAREDLAKHGPNLSGVVAQTLRGAVRDGMEKLVIDALLDHGMDHDSDTEETYASYRAKATSEVDGRLASSAKDIRVLFGAATYAHADGKFRSENAGGGSALEALQSMTAGVRVSAHVPPMDATTKTQKAIIARTMRPGHSAAFIWEGIELLSDPYSESPDGQLRLTGIAMADYAISRDAAFVRFGAKIES